MKTMLQRALKVKMLAVTMLALLAALALSAGSAAAASTIAVTSTKDEQGTSTERCEAASGECTLRAAVELADERGGEVTIQTPPGEYAEELTPSTLQIADGSTITISGAGAEKTTINGDLHESVFLVESGASLTLDDVTVMGGSGFVGGAVNVDGDGTLLVEDSDLREDRADADGGAIYGEESSTITVRRSHITDDSAYLGGGVFANYDSSVTLQESLLEENFAFFGGGVYGEEGAPIDVASTEVLGNFAFDTGGGVAETQGGFGCGVRADGQEGKPGPDAVASASSYGLTISKSTIAKNATDEGDGGGVYVGDSDGCLLAEASGGPRPSLEPLSGEPIATITQSTIADNTAGEYGGDGIGGGVFLGAYFAEDPIIDSTIADNRATATGGGVAVEEGFEDLVSDTVADNSIVSPEIEESPDLKTKAAELSRHSPDAGPETSSSEMVHHDTAEGPKPGGNLAADPDAFAEIDLRNTIVAEPEGGESENCNEGYIESWGSEGGYNLDFPASPLDEEGYDECGLSEKDHDRLGVNPLLAKEGLHANGGPTETIALEGGSPAIGAVPVKEDCEEEGSGPALPDEEGKLVAVDQRGVLRPGIPGEGCDIGAYEYQGAVGNPEAAPAPAPTPEGKPSPKGEVLPIKITSPAQCASLRDITIHIQHVRQLGVVSAVVSIDGKHKRTLTGRHLTTAINLRGLPKGTFTVEIVARTRSGHTLHGKRVYHTCHTKLPGHSYLKL